MNNLLLDVKEERMGLGRGVGVVVEKQRVGRGCGWDVK